MQKSIRISICLCLGKEKQPYPFNCFASSRWHHSLDFSFVHNLFSHFHIGLCERNTHSAVNISTLQRIVSDVRLCVLLSVVFTLKNLNRLCKWDVTLYWHCKTKQSNEKNVLQFPQPLALSLSLSHFAPVLWFVSFVSLKSYLFFYFFSLELSLQQFIVLLYIFVGCRFSSLFISWKLKRN